MRVPMVALALAGALLGMACSTGPGAPITPTPTIAAPTPSGPRPPVRPSPLPPGAFPFPIISSPIASEIKCPIENWSAIDFPSRPVSPPVIPEPNTFCGRLWIDGTPAPDSTVVEAVVVDRVCDRREASGGQYRVTIVEPYCGQSGDEVKFRVDGRWAKQTGTMTHPLMPWFLDLTVGEEPVSTPQGGSQ